MISRRSPSCSRKGDSPRGSRQRKTNSANCKEQQDRHRARDARPDNGRDGKLYVDPDSDEKQRRIPTHLLSASFDNNVNPRFDNGRDGKLYVEPDNGRDGKLYLELEDDEEQSSEAVNEAQSLEAAPGKSDAMGNSTVRSRGGLATDDIGTAKQPNTAAMTIQRAIAGAAIRRRSSGHGGGAKGTGKTVPETNLVGLAGGGRRALSERESESDGTQRNGERVTAADVSTATSEVRGIWCLFMFGSTITRVLTS